MKTRNINFDEGAKTCLSQLHEEVKTYRNQIAEGVKTCKFNTKAPSDVAASHHIAEGTRRLKYKMR